MVVEPDKKKEKMTRKRNERWAGWIRGQEHELARLVKGIIFLVIFIGNIELCEHIMSRPVGDPSNIIHMFNLLNSGPLSRGILFKCSSAILLYCSWGYKYRKGDWPIALRLNICGNMVRGKYLLHGIRCRKRNRNRIRSIDMVIKPLCHSE